MTRQIFFLLLILINAAIFPANSQSDSSGQNVCAEIELKYDVELMKTPPSEIKRGEVLDHEVELSALHYEILSEVFKNCGEPANVEVKGVSTSGPLAYSGPVIQRQMASRRIGFFANWATEQGMSRAKINIGTVGSEEPSPASLVLAFSTFEPIKAIVRTVDEPPVSPEETESSCDEPKQFAFSANYDADSARQALSDHLTQCGAVPGITFELSFEDLSEERMAAWSAWNEMFVEVQNSLPTQEPEEE